MKESKTKYVSDALIKALLKVIENHNSDNNIINISLESICEYLGIITKESTIENFLYYLSHENIEWVVGVISMLFDIVDNSYKNELIKIIKLERNMFYFESDIIKKFEDSYYSLSKDLQRDYLDHLEYTEDSRHLDDYVMMTRHRKGNIFFNKNEYTLQDLSKDAHLIHINEYITYDKTKCLFINPDNKEEFNVFERCSYDEMMGILINNAWDYVPYRSFYMMTTMQENSIKNRKDTEKNKKITDMKNNLLVTLNKKLKIEKKLDFIIVNNGLKIVLE